MSRKQNAIKVDERDNVCTVVTSTGLSPGGVLLNGVKVLEEIPYGHKVALSSIKKDEPIIRYGETIGYANATISEGGWINEDKMHVLEPVDIANYSIKSDEPDKEYRFRGKAVKKRYFMGYLNKDGTAGTRNILAINTTVQCTEGVVNKAVEKIKQEILPKYPNVDDVIAINHIYGCGIAIDGENADIPKRTIRNIAENPNFGEERLVVSLGCEKLIPQGAFNTSHLNENDYLITLQDYKGFYKMMGAICKKAEVLIKRLNKRKRVLCDLSHLVIGLQCGGSDALSGVTANPAIGYAADLLVQHKAKVMFSEVTEVRDAVHSLFKRIRNKELREKLIAEMLWYDNYLKKSKVDRSANTTPGNKKGGLSTIIEKSMGSVAKSGTSEIVDVLSPGERIKKSGLSFAATPASDFVCGSEQLASGMTLQVFSTGRGTPYNLRQAPVIKVASNNGLYNKWEDLLDVNAGTIAAGEKTIKEVGEEIFETIIEVASGKKEVKSEKHGLYNQLAIFNPAPVT